MKFTAPTIQGKITKRYKRFLADVILDSGEEIPAHLANTGSMKSCYAPSWRVLLTYHDNPKRKLKHSLEMTHNGESWIGVNTGKTNQLAVEAIENGVISELSQYICIEREKTFGDSRIDLFLHNNDQTAGHWVEIKSVTLKSDSGNATFPDAVTKRGQKHLTTLMSAIDQGYQSSLLFVVQREDVSHFNPSESLDQDYADLLQQAQKHGVQILVYQCQLDESEIKIAKPIPIIM